MSIRDRMPLSLLFFLAAAGSQSAFAQVDHALDNFSFSIGAFSSSTDAKLRADGTTVGSGTPVNFDRDLGQGGTSALPYFDATWRPWDRHEFEISYYSNSNSSTRTLSRDIVFNGNTFIAGAQLGSKFSTDAGSLTYRYWLWSDERAAFGFSAGLQWYSFTLDLTGTAGVVGPDGSVTQTATTHAKASSTLPDPSLGLSYRYQIADWVRLVADGGGFKIKIEDVDATLYNARLGVEFYPWTNFGIVTQYSYNTIDADVSRTNFLGNANFDFSGFQVLLKVRF